MKGLKTLGFHAALLVVAAGAAYVASSTDGDASAQVDEKVKVWGGDVAAFENASYTSPNAIIRVEQKKDDAGSFCVVVSEREDVKEANEPSQDAIANPPKQLPMEKKTKRFVSVTGCERLRKGLAPLLAVRAVGMVDKKRFPEFGLDSPIGALKVTLDGSEHELSIGGTTPGGGDYYALLPASGQVFAVPGDVVRLFEYAESRLIERALHQFEPESVDSVQIGAKDSKTTLVRMQGTVDGWARKGREGIADETAGNWMSKLSKLRVAEFEEKLSPSAIKIVQLNYLGGGKPLGYTELLRVGEGKQAKYWARTETTRWFVSILRSAGEQLEEDLAAVVQ